MSGEAQTFRKTSSRAFQTSDKLELLIVQMVENSSNGSNLIYPDLAAAIKDVSQQWCQQNGYTEPFYRNGELWAFPPNGVMPVKIKDVMNQDSKQVWIGRVSLFILPDGSVAKNK